MYDMHKYAEYFVIDEGYYPEITESSIKDPENTWEKTYPHTDIVALMKLLERALSRSDSHSLWLEGSYGTGKSRIIWMLQNLLSCSEDEFDAYFELHDKLREEIDLRERLRTIRRGGIVTATRYGTGSINTPERLIFAVFESLSSALRKGGYKFDGAKTLRGKIAAWLESDAANLEMFRAKLKKPAYQNYGALVSRTPEEILERLKNPNAEVSALVEEILKLGENEGIIAFNIGMDDLTAWITEVIDENNLSAIVLFWDEFSKFFGNNRDKLDEFQRLAELSAYKPFYLFIATHEAESLTGEGDQAFRIVSDRFTHVNITMPDNIAFELIGAALQVKKVARHEWEGLSAALRERTTKPREVVEEFAHINDKEILINILPIHPMAAILLKNLAVYFASNQRSIFNFIKNSNPNVEAFQEFIAKKSPENGDLLTIDYLWNFFYESGTDEHSGNFGRMNLKPSIRNILDSYALNSENLDADEQAVFKTVLLFQAIDHESRSSVEIFRPTEKNLELAFTGVADMEHGRAVTIANNLVRKNILFKKPGKVETFAVMALGGNTEEIERQKKLVAENVRTADLIANFNLEELANLSAAQKFRYILYAATADNFTATISKIANEGRDYQIKVVICFARNEDEQYKLKTLLAKELSAERCSGVVFIDATPNLLNREIFTRWVENSAGEKYWRGKDNPIADKMKEDAAACLKEWYDSLQSGFFVYYPAVRRADARTKITCQNAAQITVELRDNVRRIYPYSFDDANITDTLFAPTQLKKLAESGILQKEYSMLKQNSIRAVLRDVWNISGNYWEVYPDLNISRLKVELDALINSELERDVRISFEEIVDFLVERGFMPLNIYAFLTGFLLKEYAGDPYRFSAGIDGNQGGAMNVARLSELISDAMKQTFSPVRNYHSKYLEIMSPSQQKFMKFALKVFDVTENISIEQTAQKLRLKLKNLGYPLWCYADAANERYKEFLHLLSEIANSKQTVSISALAERAGEFLANNPEAYADLKIFLTANNGREIFTAFLREFEGGIFFELAEKIGVENPVAQCRERISSGDSIWLHDKETATDDLRKFIADYEIVLESRKFGVDGKSFGSCVRNWAEHCRYCLKIPVDVLIDFYPPLKNFLEVLKEICERGEIAQGKRQFFLSQIRGNVESIQQVFSEQSKILREKYSYQVEGLSDAELNQLQNSLPGSSFTDSQSNFYKHLDECAKRIKGNRLHEELLELWKKVAGKNLPREWSKLYRTPILAMVPPSELGTAQKVFAIVMAAAPPEKDVRFALDYLKQSPTYFAAIKSARDVEAAFSRAILADNDVLLENDEVRNYLARKFQGEIYNWYPNSEVKKLVEDFAKNKYYNGGAYDKISARVRQMADYDAKKLLIQLLDKNYEIGLKLLRES